MVELFIAVSAGLTILAAVTFAICFIIYVKDMLDY